MPKYKEVTPKDMGVTDTQMSVDMFMDIWKMAGKYIQQIERVTRPAQVAISNFFGYRPGELLWEQSEISIGSKGIQYVLLRAMFPRDDEISNWTIPLTIVLGGEEAITKHLQAEKEEEQRAAVERGKRIEAADKEKRRKRYEELRLEFDSTITDIIRIPKNA